MLDDFHEISRHIFLEKKIKMSSAAVVIGALEITQRTHKDDKKVVTTSLQRHKKTSLQRRYNVTTLQRRCNDVVAG